MRCWLFISWLLFSQGDLTVDLSCDIRPTVASSQCSANFSSPVQGFVASAIAVGNATLTNFIAVNPSNYTFVLVPKNRVVVMHVSIPAGSATNNISEQNFASLPIVIYHDADPPTVVLRTQATNPTRVSPLQFTAQFSKSVVGLSLGKFIVTSATLSNLVAQTTSLYSFTVTPSSSCVLIKLSLPAAVARDTAGNWNLASMESSIQFDLDPPLIQSLLSSSTSIASSSASVIPLVVTFTEPVFGFNGNSIYVGNGTLSNFLPQSDIKYSFDVIPSSAELVNVIVPAGVANDQAGNKNLASFPLQIARAVRPLTLTLMGPAMTNTAPVAVSATFSASVTPFRLEDITITNATISRFNFTSASRCVFDVIPISSVATITLSLAPGITSDIMGNQNPFTQLNIDYDSSAPVTQFSVDNPRPVQNAPIVDSPIHLSVELSKPVKGNFSSALTVLNARVDNVVMVSSTLFSLDLVPANSTCVVQAQVVGDLVDLYGNAIRPSSVWKISYDTEAPVAYLSTPAISPVASSPIPFTVSFGEAVHSVRLQKISVTNAYPHGLQMISPSEYSFLVSPFSSSGNVAVQVLADAAEDLAGFSSLASSVIQLTYDSDFPLVVLSSTAPNPGSSALIPVSATFSKDVQEFSAAKIVVHGGILQDFVAQSGSRYDFNIHVDSLQSSITVDIPSKAASDSSGNYNSDASQLLLIRDAVPPQIGIRSTNTTKKDSNGATQVSVLISCTEVVRDLTGEDISLSGPGLKGNFAQLSALEYSLDIVVMSTFAALIVSVEGGVVGDLAGNLNLASNILTIVYDAERPYVNKLSTTAESPTSKSPIPFTLRWSEPVTMNSSHVSVLGGELTQFVLVTASDYTFNVIPEGTFAPVIVSVAEGMARDAYGNLNLGSTSLIVLYDAEIPIVTRLEATNPGPYKQGPIPFTLEFSEPVLGFVASDILVKNGVVNALVPSGSNTGVWSFSVTPIVSTCVIEVSIPLAVCTDRAKNLNAPSGVTQISFDSDAPVATYFGSEGLITNRSFIPVRIVFSEPIKSLTLNSVTVTGGNVDNARDISESEYEFLIIPTNVQGNVVVTFPIGAAIDKRSLLPNTASYETTIFRDSLPPQVQMSVVPSDSSLFARVTFSKPVTGFSPPGISVVNAMVGDFRRIDASSYTFLVYPQTSRLVVTFTIRPQVAFDLAGNGNTALDSPYSQNYDNESPSVNVSAPSAISSKTIQNPIRVSVSFSKPCFGFAERDNALVVVNGIASKIDALDANSQQFSVLVAPWPPSSEFVVSVGVPEGVCADASGNVNREGEPIVIVHDSLSPRVLSIESSSPNPGNISPLLVTVRFSEVVNGFTTDALIVGGGTLNMGPPSSYTANSEFTFRVDPAADTITVTIQVDPSRIQDRSGNVMIESFRSSFVYDSEKPIARLNTSMTTTSQSPITISLFWSEPVMPFREDAIRLSNGVAGNLIKISDTEYSFEISPFSVGVGSTTIGVAVRRSSVYDLAGNANLGSPELVINFNPSPGISPLQVKLSTTTNPSFASFVSVLAEWNFPVTGFQIGDITIAGGQSSEFTQISASSYTFNVTPLGGSTLTMQIPDYAAMYQGAANRWFSNKLNVSFEIKPTVSLSTDVSLSVPTNKSPILFRAKFSQAMLLFNASCIAVDGGVVGDVIPLDASRSSFAFYVVPSSFFAPVAARVISNCAKDFTENYVEQQSTTLVLQYDSIAPTVVITPTGVSGATITFSEIVSDISQQDVYVSGGNITSFVTLIPQKTYAITIVPLSAQSLVTIRVFSNVTTDLAGNANVASTALALTSGSLPPIISFWGVSPTNAPVSVTIAVSKPATLLQSSIVVQGGSIARFTATSATSFEVSLSPPSGSLSGSITLQIAQGVVVDQLGNGNVLAASTTVVYDYVSPEVSSFASNLSFPTSQSPIPVTIVFSKPVTNFSAGSLLMEGGSLKIVSGDKTTFFLLVTPSSSVIDIVLRLPVQAVRDLLGNTNTRSSTLTLRYDSEPPRVQSITTDVTSPSSSDVISVSIKWTAPISGFEDADCEVGGAVKQNFEVISNILFSLKLVPNAVISNVTLTIRPRTVLSLAGQSNSEIAQIFVLHDTVGPRITLTTPLVSPTNATQIPVLVTLSEAVPNFDIGKLSVVGGPIQEFVQKTDVQYEFKVLLIASEEDVVIEVVGGVCTDFARNPNVPSERLQIKHDAEPPFVQSWGFGNGNPTNRSPIVVSLAFNKPIMGFSASGIYMEGGSLVPSTFVSVSTTQYRFQVRPSTSVSNILLRVQARSAKDAAGNSNLASNVNVLYDSLPPEVVSLEITGSSQRSPIPFVMYWSKKVLDFAISDFIVVDGIITRFVEIQSAFSSTTKYGFDVLPRTLNSDVSITIRQNAVSDLAGNYNNGTKNYVFAHDAEPILILSLDISVNDPATSNPVPGFILFSKPVVDFALASFLTEGCSLQDLSVVSNREYRFSVVSATEEVDVRIRLPPDSVHDAGGNSNAESDDLKFRFDSLPPTIVINSTIASPTSASQFAVSITFSESVTAFADTDLHIEMATVVGFQILSSSRYLLTLVPLAKSVQVRLWVKENTVQDVAGHGNVASDMFVMICDSEPPRVQLQTTSLTTISSPVIVSAVFTEPITGFVLETFQVVGGTPRNLRDDSGTGSIYMIDIIPQSSTANITVSLAANAVQDLAGNRNLAATQLFIVYDTDFPSVQISSNSSARTSPLIAYAIWSEPVSKFSLDYVTTVGAVPYGLIQQSLTVFEFRLLPACSVVRIQVDVAGGVVTDMAGNSNAGARSWITYDADPPTVQYLTTTASSITSRSPIPVTVSFSEPVVGFGLASLNVSNATARKLTGVTTSLFTWELVPTVASGLILVDILAGATKDASGNPNLPAIQLSVMYDAEPPTVLSITTPLTSPVSSSAIPVTVVFSEAINDMKISAVSVVGGSVIKLTQKSPGSYTFTLTPSGRSGHITLFIKENSVQDAAGNGNIASATLELDHDENPPTVVLSSSLHSPSKEVLVPITAVFSKPVNAIDVNRILLTGGTARNLVVQTPQKLTFEVTPNSGYVTVSVLFPQGLTQDVAGNQNLPSNQFTFLHDSVRPDVLRLSTQAISPTNLTQLPFELVFTKAVVGFVTSCISVDNAAATTLLQISPDRYTFLVVPSRPVTRVRVEIKGAVVSDEAGNANTPSEVIYIDYDSSAPTVKFSSVSSPTSLSVIPLTVTWNEPVNGFEVGDLTCQSTCLFRNFTAINASSFMVFVIPIGLSVSMNIAMKPTSVQDLAGNWNNEATSLTIVYDTGALTVELTTPSSLPASRSPIKVVATFNKEVSGFTLDDINAIYGFASNLQPASASRYEFDITPNTSTITVQVSIPERVVQDKAGNLNRASTSLQLAYDSDTPFITSLVTTTGRSISSMSPIPISIVFSEPIMSFGLDSLVVNNGTKQSGIFSSPTTFSFVIFPSGSIITVEVKPNTFQDLASNFNKDAALLLTRYDPIPPTIQLSSMAEKGPSPTRRYSVVADISEPVEYFGLESLTVTGAQAENFAIVSNVSMGKWECSFDLIPSSASETIGVMVSRGKVTDLAGNLNSDSNSLQFIHDSLSLQVTQLKAIVKTPTNISPVPFTLTFSAEVMQSPCSRLAIWNGTLGSCQADNGSTYIFYVIPSSSYATIRVQVPAAITHDRAQNQNLRSEVLEVVHDSVVPTILSLTGPSRLPTNLVPIPFVVVFSEPVFNMQPNSISVTGGTVSRLRDGTNSNTFLFQVNPDLLSGTVIVGLNEDIAMDAAGNFNTAFNTNVSIRYDIDLPRPQLSTSMDLSQPINTSPILITCIVNKPVVDFTEASINSLGGTIVNFNPISTTSFTFGIVPLFESVVMTVKLDSDAIHDNAGNGNEATAPLIIRYDTARPSVIIIPDAPIKNAAFRLTLFFSEPVTQFSQSGLVLENAQIIKLTEVSSTQYIFNLSPSADVIVRASVPSGVAYDSAGLPNVASQPVTIEYGKKVVNCGSNGPVTLSLRNLNQFLHCTVIRNDVTIDSDPTMPAFNLPNLLSISGKFIVSGVSWIDLQGFSNLASVSDTLTITNNPRLKTLKGLGSVTRVGSISIKQSPALVSLDGLNARNLIVDGALSIEQSPTLVSLVGICGISFLKGQVSVIDTPALCCLPLRDLLVATDGLQSYDLDNARCSETCTADNNLFCNHCTNSSCNSHGRCNSTDTGFTCDCYADYTGTTCSESIAKEDRCTPNPCQNGGTCSSGKCVCPTPFSGPLCLQTSDGDILTLVAETAVSVPRSGSVSTNSLDVGPDNTVFIRFGIPPSSPLLRSTRDGIQTVTVKLFYQGAPPTSVHVIDMLSPTSWTPQSISWTSRPAIAGHDNRFPLQWKTRAEQDFVEVDVSSLVLSSWGTTSFLSFQITGVTGTMVSYNSVDPSMLPQLIIKRADRNAVPTIQSARYSNLSPNFVQVAFDLDTNWRRLQIDRNDWCKQLLSPQTLLSLGSTSSCRWVDERQFVIYTPSSIFSSGFNLELRANSLQNQAQSSARVAGGTVNIQSPAFTEPPSVSLIGPTAVSTCTDFILDATASLNLMSPQPLVDWFLNGVPLPNSGDLQLSVIGRTLTASKTHNFSVAITNGYGQRGTAMLSIAVQPRPVPLVTILSNAQIVASQDLILQPIFEFPGCASVFEQSTRFQFAWSLNYFSVPTPIVLSNPTHRELVIPAGTLLAGATYTFALRVVSADPLASFNTQALATFSVVASPLVAIISQGNRIVAAGNTQLDALGSYDPDDPLQSRSSSWSFYWDCQALGAFQANPCKSVGSTLQLMNLEPGSAYRVAVHFTDNSESDRHAFDSVIIQVSTMAKIPLVSVQSSKVGTNLLLQGNASSLVGTSSLDLIYLWTITSSGKNASLEELQLDNLPLDTPFLVIPRQSLLREYLFQLSVREPSSSSTSLFGSAWLKVVGDTLPFDGLCTIADSGTALLTSFTYRCQGWQSILTPIALRYNFKFAPRSTPESGITELVKGSLVPYSTFFLPSGNWTLIAEIVDFGGAVARSTRNVTVLPAPTSTTSGVCFAQNITNALVVPAVEQNNTAQLFYLISLLSDVLNTECSRPNSITSLSCLLTNSSSLDLQKQLRGRYLDLILDVKDGVLPSQNRQIARALASLSTPQTCRSTDSLDFTNKVMSLLDDQITNHFDIFSAGDLLDGLSNLAASAARCTYIDNIQSLSRVLAQRTVESVLVGQTATIESLNVKLAIQRLLTRRNVSLSVSGSSVYFSSLNWSMTTSTAFVDVVLGQYGHEIVECRTQKGKNDNSSVGGDRNLLSFVSTDIASDLLRIQLMAGDQSIPLSSPLVFSLSVNVPQSSSPGCVLNTEPRCVWWDSLSSSWSEQSCAVVDFRSTKTGGNEVVCKCSILADFAVRFARLPQRPCYIEFHLGFIAFAIVYLLAWFFPLWRLRKWSFLEASALHSVFLIECAPRSVLGFYLSGITGWYPLWQHIAILTAIPQVVIFFLLTKRILSWISDTTDIHRIRWTTYGIYVMLLLALVTVFFGPMLAVVAVVGATLIALICILYPVVFLAMILCRYYRFRGTTEAANQGVTSISLVCFCLLISALSWLVALYKDEDLRSASTTMLIYLVFDFVGIIILLRINYFSFAAPRESRQSSVVYSTVAPIPRRESVQLTRMPSSGRLARPLPSTPLPDIDVRFDDSVSGSNVEEGRARPPNGLFAVDEYASETNEMLPVSMKYESENTKYDECSRRMEPLVSFDECSKEDLDDIRATPSSMPANFRSPDSRDFVAHLHTPSPVLNHAMMRRADRRNVADALEHASSMTPSSQEVRFTKAEAATEHSKLLLTPSTLQGRYRSPETMQSTSEPGGNGMHLISLKESARYEDIVDFSE